MKINQIFENIDYRNLDDQPDDILLQLISKVSHDSVAFIAEKLTNPSLEVQQALYRYGDVDAIRWVKNVHPELQQEMIDNMPTNIMFIQNPTPEILKQALTDGDFWDEKESYDRYITRYFKNNQILINKWIKYGDNMRTTIK